MNLPLVGCGAASVWGIPSTHQAAPSSCAPTIWRPCQPHPDPAGGARPLRPAGRGDHLPARPRCAWSGFPTATTASSPQRLPAAVRSTTGTRPFSGPIASSRNSWRGLRAADESTHDASRKVEPIFPTLVKGGQKVTDVAAELQPDQPQPNAVRGHTFK